jgi:hypothetical protein
LNRKRKFKPFSRNRGTSGTSGFKIVARSNSTVLSAGNRSREEADGVVGAVDRCKVLMGRIAGIVVAA